MTVSVVIANWNGRELLRACLAALGRQTRAPDEVIVVDNGSTDGSLDLIRQQFPAVRLVALPENRGFAVGNNVGIQAARGQYIALLNNDAEPEPAWLQELGRAMDAYPAAGLCASKILTQEEPPRIDSAGDAFWRVGVGVKRGEGEIDAGQYDEPGWVFGASAAAAVYRRTLFEAIGGFDERFSPAYHEDTDLNFRAQLRGYRCRYVPSAIVRHRVSATLGRGSARLQYLRARNAVFVVAKNLPAGLWKRHGIDVVTYHGLLSGIHLVRGKPAYLAGCLAALAMLPALRGPRQAVQRMRTVSDDGEALLSPITVTGALAAHWSRYANR